MREALARLDELERSVERAMGLAKGAPFGRIQDAKRPERIEPQAVKPTFAPWPFSDPAY